jgi:hypothetical protein
MVYGVHECIGLASASYMQELQSFEVSQRGGSVKKASAILDIFAILNLYSSTITNRACRYDKEMKMIRQGDEDDPTISFAVLRSGGYRKLVVACLVIAVGTERDKDLDFSAFAAAVCTVLRCTMLLKSLPDDPRQVFRHFC